MTDVAVAVQLVRESQNPHEFSEACQVVTQLFQQGNMCAALMSADSLNEAVELRDGGDACVVGLGGGGG